jgi:2-C-methyl-D-erythritol 4-phosphate cytidylyltransferase
VKSEKVLEASVIVLAAGSGSRTELKTPKQYIEIGEKKIIEYSLNTLSKLLNEVVVVVPDPEEWKNLNIAAGVRVTKGGNTRTKSLLKGLELVTNSKVLIHDASRPIVPTKIVKDIVDQLELYACVYPALPVASTIVVDKDGMLQATPERSRFKEIQTPQGFHVNWIKKALQEFGDKHSHIPELIRWLGKEVKHIEGSPWLFKITYEPDVYAAHVYIDKHQQGEAEG